MDESDRITIARCAPIDASVRVPPSKSLTNRALAAASLARGVSTIRNPLLADDTLLMAGALRDLGIRVAQTPASWTVQGCAGRIPASEARLFLGNAGTAMRFLTPIVATGRGRFVLDGSDRMRARPIGDLLSALGAMGVAARSLERNGCPPVEVEAAGLRGGDVSVRGSVSSQFLSGLLLAAPCAEGDLRILLEGPLVSRPYVDLTIDVMRRFGAQVEEEPERSYRVRAGGYSAAACEIEGDASSACWWFAAAAVTGGRVRVEGIPRDSKQGDLRFLDLLERMGCRVRWIAAGGTPAAAVEVEGGPLKGIEADLRDMPDAAPALGAVALFAAGPTRIWGAAHLRDKESDRIAGLAGGLAALGASVEEHRDGITIRPGAARGATVDPLGDHRLAMAFAVAALGIGEVTVLDPSCVTKSYPGFFEALRRTVGPST